MHKVLQDVSTKDLVRARRLAARHRAAVACARCKFAKIRCADNRPCKKCTISKLECVEAKTDSPSALCFKIGNNTESSNDTRFDNPVENTALFNENQPNGSFIDQLKTIVNVYPSPRKIDFGRTKQGELEKKPPMPFLDYQQPEHYPVPPCRTWPARFDFTEIHSASDNNSRGTTFDLLQNNGDSFQAYDGYLESNLTASPDFGSGTPLFLPAMRIPSSLICSSTPVPPKSSTTMRITPSFPVLLSSPMAEVFLHRLSSQSPPFPHALLPRIRSLLPPAVPTPCHSWVVPHLPYRCRSSAAAAQPP
jgi:hypothetical protein